MKPDEKHLDYLKGTKFNNVLRVPFSDSSILTTRKDKLIELVKGKNIIHVGCVDHMELIAARKKQGLWMHDLLMQNSKRCLGIDINKEGIDYLKNTLKIGDVFYNDLGSDNLCNEILNADWDYIVLGEIVEHLDNPTSFLDKIRTHYGHKIKNIVITVPNAFKLKNFKNSLKNFEEINSDHRFWFTPYTISKILIKAGYKVDEILMCLNDGDINARGLVSKRIYTKYPLLREDIVAIGSFK
jgi:hypothetical protein